MLVPPLCVSPSILRLGVVDTTTAETLAIVRGCVVFVNEVIYV